MKTLKKELLLLLCVLLVSLLGCGIPGSPNAPVEDDSVTLQATVSAPLVESEMIKASAKYSSAEVLAQLAANGKCLVNAQQVQFSLDPANGRLIVEKLPPAAGYEIMLKAGGLELCGLAAHTGRIIEVPAGISLQTTAEYHLRKAYARSEALAISSFADYNPNAGVVSAMTAAMQTELNKATATAESLAAVVSAQVNSISAQKSFADLFVRSGPAFDFSGKWKGSVSYFLHNSAGTRAMIVTAIAEADISCAGNSVSGSFRLVPFGVVPLLKDLSGLTEPSETAFAFTGSCDGRMVKFTRRGTLGPLAGKNIDSWELFPVNKGLACRSLNVETAYNTGIKAVPGDFFLIRND